MSDPFEDDYRVDRPQPAIQHESPRRFQNNIMAPPTHQSDFHSYQQPQQASPNRYSPSVAFGRRQTYNEDTFHSPFTSPTKVSANPYQNAPDLTPRQQWAELESPKRRNQNTVIVIDDDDDDEADEDLYGKNSTYDIQRSATRSSNSTFASSTRILPPPKPIFSASTFAAANYNSNNRESSGPFEAFPRLTQDEMNTRVSSGSTVDYEAEDAFNEKLENQSTTYSGATIDDYEHDSHYLKEKHVGFAEDDDDSNQGENDFDNAMMYEVPNESQPRRHRSMVRKQIKPMNGNLVLENPVPTKLASFLPRRDEDEFLFMRYSACTASPDEFQASGFTLRAAMYNREIELCVCITMYNEDEVSFARTMHSVMKNVAHLCSRNRSRIWGPDGWKKVQVVIVSDGRAKINENVLDVLGAMGVYQEGIAKSYVNNKEVKAHLFEYTTQVSLDSNLEFKSAEVGIVPVQVLFCLKEKNAKKINSHRWLFNGFCETLKPKVIVLLDVGTKPNLTCLYHLWKAFDKDSDIAGAAGEIKALKGKGWRKLLNPLVASQNFEYKMSNILDKPLESAFGYISVLPGALSAYRYKALKNHEDGTGPLNSYFKGESLHDGPNRDVFSANMYLAEDRILCWELVAKKGEKWLLKYVKEAKGETDLPETVPEFISQRRRWLNGALFAALYSQLHFRQIWNTSHTLGRKIFLHIEFFYQFVQLLFSWFSVGNFYLTFYFLVGSLSGNDIIPHNGGFWLYTIFNYICICVLCALFIISMGNRPQGAVHLFVICMVLLSICSTFALVCGLVFVFKTFNGDSTSSQFLNIIVSLLSTYGLYVFTSILYLDPWHIITSSVQYFLLLASYTCTLQIFAFCNTHDVSWGTKGDNNPTKSLGNAVIKKDSQGREVVEVDMPGDQLDIDSAYKSLLNNISVQRVRNKTPERVEKAPIGDDDYYRDVRTRVVLTWLLTNLILIMSMTQTFDIADTASNKYLAFILWSVAALSLFRACGSIYYLANKYARTLLEAKHRWEDGSGNASPTKSFSFKRLFKSSEDN